MINTFTGHSYITPLPTLQHGVPSLCPTLHDTSMNRKSTSHYQVRRNSPRYQVSSTSSLNTANSLPSQHYSMGSLPLFISPCHLYEQKEHFTLPGMNNTFAEHSYLIPLPTPLHRVPSLVQLFMTRRQRALHNTMCHQHLH